MKIYIITDLEGVAGVVDFKSQTYPDGKYFEKAKELLTEEVNACCDGLKEMGVDEILVVDGHGPGGILPEKIHPEAKLYHGRPISSLWEIDKGWDAVFLLAHHSMNGTEKGNLNHTYSSQQIVKMELNGEEIGEIGFEIYIAGCFDIPVVFISGDEAACKEGESYVPDIEKAVVKWEDPTEGIPAFLAFIGIPFTYNIGEGMALGFISYSVKSSFAFSKYFPSGYV